ncbi:hypothetical protein D3C84_508560 [compost metagenome]
MLGAGALFAHAHQQGAAFTQATNQLQVDLVPAGDGLAIHRNDFLAGLEPRPGGDAIRRHGADDRAHLLAAEHGQHPEEQQREQEVGDRPGRHYGDALADRLAVEGLPEQFGGHLGLALVEHLHVAAERNGGHDELGALAVIPAEQRRAEAHGETQDLDPAAPRDPEMAELVEGHQHPEGNQGAENHV